MRLATLAAVLFAAAPALAAPPVTGKGPTPDAEFPVPAKAVFVASVNGWGKARARLAAVVEKAAPADAKKVAAWVDEQLKQALNGRELKGIDPDARVFASFGLDGFMGDNFPLDIF